MRRGIGAGMLVAGCLLGSVVWLGVHRPAPPGTANLLLVTLDTLRADHCSTYGYAHPTTPVLDTLGREGTVFEDAYTPTPTTGPSHSTLFTSGYPAAHGVLKNGYAMLAERRTLAEVLRGAGWQTGAVVSAFPLAARFGYGRGFEHFDDEFPVETASSPWNEWEGFRLRGGFDRRGDATTDRALAWLARTSPARPWFLWVHYFDPHAPYDPPPGYRRLVRDPGERWPAKPLDEEIVAYDAEVRFTDEQVGRLVREAETKGSSGGLLVVVAADHGEGLMSHGWMEHGVNLYEELVRTLLLVRWPGHVRAGQRLHAPVGLIDVAPTVLALLGVPSTSMQPQGEDLSRVLGDGGAPPANRLLFFQRRLYTERDQQELAVGGEEFGVRMGAWKYVSASAKGPPELFDLDQDPGETRNLHTRAADVEERLAATLQQWVATQRGRPAGARSVDPDDVARLRALGYVE